MSRMTEKKKELNREINKRVGNNIKYLLEKRGISQVKFSEDLAKKEWGYTLDRTTINKLINESDESNLSIPFLIMSADYFQITVDFLVGEHENIDYSYEKEKTENQRTPKSNRNLVEGGNSKNELIVENPKSVFFKHYLHDYFCYYYSTIADETKSSDPILEGTLKLSEKGDICCCELIVDTKKYTSNGEKFFKIYRGQAVVCLASQTIHCAMRDSSIGEYCDIIFRYSSLNSTEQACRMAVVLSSSSGPDKRYPVVHRMLLSKDKIIEKHYDLIKPQLCMNSSEILISEEKLDALKKSLNQYAELIEELKKSNQRQMYLFTESMIEETAKRLSINRTETFINVLRGEAHVRKYNKIAQVVDENMWNLLHDAGYYKENNIEESQE